MLNGFSNFSQVVSLGTLPVGSCVVDVELPTDTTTRCPDQPASFLKNPGLTYAIYSILMKSVLITIIQLINR